MACPPRRSAYLLAQQCPAGGFRLFYDTGSTCASDAETDTDATSLAVEALHVVAQTAAVHDAEAKATSWLLGQQDATAGSFSGTGPTATPNSNSTGIAAAALRVSGQTAAADKAAGYVEGLQIAAGADAGALGYDHDAFVAVTGGTIDASSRDQWRRATAQAVLALGLPGYGQIVAVPAPPSGGGSGGPVTGGTSTATLSVSAAPAGGTLRVGGSGFRPGESVQVWLHSTPVLLGSGQGELGAGIVALDGHGSPAATTARVPAWSSSGSPPAHQAVAGSRSRPGRPCRCPVAPEGPAAPTLPDTGGRTNGPLLLGISLVLAGTALVRLASQDGLRP